MQSEQNQNTTMEIYKPNHVLYRWLLAGAAFISIMSAFIPQDNPLFSILIGIGSGGIASVIVAWLIDISTCKQNNEKIASTRKIVFSQLTSSIESGIQLFIMQCFRLEATSDFYCKKAWLEWLSDACNAVKNNSEELRHYCVQCVILADNIKEQTRIINEQTVSLLDCGIIGEEEKQDLSAILNICDLFHPEMKSLRISSKLAERYLSNYKLLYGIFEKLPIVGDINKVQIGSTIYQRFSRDFLENLYYPEKNE